MNASIITSPVYTHRHIVRIHAEEGRLAPKNPCGNIKQLNRSAVLVLFLDYPLYLGSSPQSLVLIGSCVMSYFDELFYAIQHITLH